MAGMIEPARCSDFWDVLGGPTYVLFRGYARETERVAADPSAFIQTHSMSS
jgi:hypothetical protein